MSIREEVEARRSENRLLVVDPLVLGAPQPRVILATADVYGELIGPWEDCSKEYRIGELRADLDHFTTGGLINVSSGPEKHAYMKHLDPPDDQVWEIRSRDPKPSMRVFGRFAETDVFIATNLMDRAYLGPIGSKRWRDEFERCKSEWMKLFPTYPPLNGATINEYISEKVVDLRQFE